MSAQVSTSAASLRAIYRHVLRNVGHAVRHEKPHIKNLRRLLRDDVAAAAAAQTIASTSAMTLEHFEQRAANTLLLYLSSMHSGARALLHKQKPFVVHGARAEKDAVVRAILSGSMERSVPSRKALQEARQAEAAAAPPLPPSSATAAHRVMLNLSAFCYFHLSPNTVLSKVRRVGGTDTAIGRRRQAKVLLNRGSKKRPWSRKKAGDRDDDDEEEVLGAGLAATTPIAALHVPPALTRGPRLVKMSSALLNSKSTRWDGQSPATKLKPLLERRREAEAKRDELVRKMYAAKDVIQRPGGGGGSKQEIKTYEAALAATRMAHGDVKSIKKLEAAEEVKERLRGAAASILAPIVQRAEARSEAWLGAARFTRWQRGEWLPP